MALITVDGIPAHPLLVHAVVVLLPLAALGGLVIALRASWRRRFGLAVLGLTAVSVGAVPLAKKTGEQLMGTLPENPAIKTHAALGDSLLPYALVFGVAVLLLLIAGRLADRERAAGRRVADRDTADRDTADRDVADRGATATTGTVAVDAEAPAKVTNTWRRVAIVAAALVAFSGVAATVQVVRIGHSGSTAVWKGVGQQR